MGRTFHSLLFAVGVKGVVSALHEEKGKTVSQKLPLCQLAETGDSTDFACVAVLRGVSFPLRASKLPDKGGTVTPKPVSDSCAWRTARTLVTALPTPSHGGKETWLAETVIHASVMRGTKCLIFNGNHYILGMEYSRIDLILLATLVF